MKCALFLPTPKHLFLFYSGSGLQFLATANQGSLEVFQLMKEKKSPVIQLQKQDMKRTKMLPAPFSRNDNFNYTSDPKFFSK